MNAYESSQQKLIPAVLIYGVHAGEVLMIQRGARPEDFHAGKWNGLGGKLEPGESPQEAALREFHEESGIQLQAHQLRSCGMILFPNFKPHRHEDWGVWLFRADLTADQKPQSVATPEGHLHFVPVDRVLDLPLWAGDRLFVPDVLRGEAVQGTIWYGESIVIKSTIERICPSR